MIRGTFRNHIGMNKEFRYRGIETGRLENFSDAVFALAITMLLISTTPPSNFLQVKQFVIDLIPFVLCVTFIVLIWYEHFIFFFRYGLRNGRIVALNGLFLTIVLFYVYPLKFLTKLIEYPIAMLTGNERLLAELQGMIEARDMADLMIIYGVGAMAVFCIFMLMYRYALKNAEVLELNEIEIFDTRTSIRTNFFMAVVPLISVLIAIIFYRQWFAGMVSGFTYFLYTPVMTLHGKWTDKRRKKLLENQGASSVATTQGEDITQ